MNNEILIAERNKRYNNWGERLPLVNNNEQKFFEATAVIAHQHLGLPIKSILYVNRLTGCQGFEFVAFSNAKIVSPVLLADEVILYPCFPESVAGLDFRNPQAHAATRMARAAKYVYDGWLPIDNLSENEILLKLRSLREALAVFSIVSGSQFEWEPKYIPIGSSRETHHLEQKELATIELFTNLSNGLPEKDKRALLRSIGWLSSSLQQNEVESKFLFAVLAIESLCTYIEQEAEDDSAFTKVQLEKKSRAERRAIREVCINETIKEMLDSNPTEAITSAYFDCVVGIKVRLRKHLEQVMGNSHKGIGLFFDGSDEQEPLYNLRHTIAHGSHDVLSDQDLIRLEKNVYATVSFSTQYIWAVLQKSFDFYNLSSKLHVSISSDFDNAVVSSLEMYKGPVDMATIYTNKS